MTDSTGDACEEQEATRGPAWGDYLLIFLVFFISGGDPAPHRNEAHYLCRLKHYWNPEWCQGDFFLETPDAHFTVVWLLGWVTLWLSLDATAWLGRILSWALLAWGWGRLSWRVAPRPLLAPLGAALLVVATELTHFAGEWIIGGFEAKTIAYGLVLLALSDVLDDRWNRAWGLLGGASALHALVGGWSVVALLFSWAVCRRAPALIEMWPGLIAGATIALLGVLPALALNTDTPKETVVEANQIYVYQRLPHHLAPLSKEPDWIVKRAGAHLRMLAALALLHALIAPKMKRFEKLRPILWWAWGAVLLSVIGLGIEITGADNLAWSASLLKYYFFRLADIATPVAGVLLLISLLLDALREKRPAAPMLVALLSIGSLFYLAGYTRDRFVAPDAPADVKMADKPSWVAMCQWIDQNTEKEALFLTPRLSHTFKWRTGRPEVVTYKDVPQDARGLVEWWRRYRDVHQVGIWPDSGDPIWARSVGAIGATRLRRLADEYGADYALSQSPGYDPARPVRDSASLPIAHRVGPFTLYDLRETGP